jgi:hypothetical protein
MGAIADGFAAFAQPLIDQTDGSMEELNKAFAISQLCFNLAMVPEDSRDEALREIRQGFNGNDEEFEAFRISIIVPMIQRHEEMFPGMHMRPSDSLQSDFAPRLQPTTVRAKETTTIDRYAPCPCNSGKKYKFCCGAKRR